MLTDILKKLDDISLKLAALDTKLNVIIGGDALSAEDKADLKGQFEDLKKKVNEA